MSGLSLILIGGIEPLSEFQHFLEQNASLYERLPTSFSSEALDALMNYPWPGNVRELKIVVERSIGTAEGPVVERKDLMMNPARGNGDTVNANGDSKPDLSVQFYTAVEGFERRYLENLLEHADGNISQASNISGASRKTIREKGKKYGLL